MARHRSTKPHLSTKARPQAPLKRAKPAPFQPNISPSEAERRAKLSPEERTAEALNAGVDAEAQFQQNWWKGENPTANSSASYSSTNDADSESASDSDHKKSFFCSPNEAPEAASFPSVSTPPSSSSSKPQSPPTGSAKSFFTTSSSNPTATPSKNAQKAARHTERRAQKKAAQQKAQAEAEARRARQEEENFHSPPSSSNNKESYWTLLLLTQKADAEKYGVYYLSLISSLQAFKSNPEAPFPTIEKLDCESNGSGSCVRVEKLGCCSCEFEKVFRGSGVFSEEWVRKERLGWHPDRFSGVGDRLENARVKAGEVFKLFQRLLDD